MVNANQYCRISISDVIKDKITPVTNQVMLDCLAQCHNKQTDIEPHSMFIMEGFDDTDKEIFNLLEKISAKYILTQELGQEAVTQQEAAKILLISFM